MIITPLYLHSVMMMCPPPLLSFVSLASRRVFSPHSESEWCFPHFCLRAPAGGRGCVLPPPGGGGRGGSDVPPSASPGGGSFSLSFREHFVHPLILSHPPARRRVGCIPPPEAEEGKEAGGGGVYTSSHSERSVCIQPILFTISINIHTMLSRLPFILQF